MFQNLKKRSSLYSWAFYDFANTIFSAVVLTFYFPLYLTNLTQRNVHLGISTTAAMAVAGLIVPWLGALSDRTGKTKAYLIVTTLFCVTFMSLLSLFTQVSLLITSFFLACLFYHASLVFYCALLPVVAEPQQQGFASGLGTALGYLGVLFAIPIANEVDSLFGRRFVFFAAALLFLLFSLPLFLWVPERKIENPSPPSLRLFASEWKKVFQTVGALLKNPPSLFFFLGNYFVVEAVNTAIFWFVIYLARVFNLPQLNLILLFLGLNFAAFLFGFVAGFLTDRYGAKKTFIGAAAFLFVTFLFLGTTNNIWVFAGFSLTGGAFGLVGTWTAARKWVVELAPREALGKYFGLYNLTTKISVVGNLIFSILADRFGFHIALLSQIVPSGLGLLFLWLAREATPRNASRYPSS